MVNNKVKFNLWNVHYAPLIENTIDKVKYGTPIPIPGAVSLSLDPTGENTPFYADGIEYYTISNNMGYSGDLEIALIPESFRVDILKESPAITSCTTAQFHDRRSAQRPMKRAKRYRRRR